MENAKQVTKEFAMEEVISKTVQIPGVKVNRDAFLTEQFANYDTDIQEIIMLGPIEAGVPREDITSIANKLIIKRTSQLNKSSKNGQ